MDAIRATIDQAIAAAKEQARQHDPAFASPSRIFPADIGRPLLAGVPSLLLILGCSQRKRPDAGLLPAIERYDGPLYRVLRKAQREGMVPPGLAVWVLSAEYGLIAGDTPIPDYDRRMTAARAAALQPGVTLALARVLANLKPIHVGLVMGHLYRRALSAPPGLADGWLWQATGGIGQQAQQLKAWLHKPPSAAPQGRGGPPQNYTFVDPATLQNRFPLKLQGMALYDYPPPSYLPPVFIEPNEPGPGYTG